MLVAQDLGGDSGGGDQERELGPLSAEWPRTGPPGLYFGDPQTSFQLAAAPKDVAPELLVSREDPAPDTPWHSSPEYQGGVRMWPFLSQPPCPVAIVPRAISPGIPAASPAPHPCWPSGKLLNWRLRPESWQGVACTVGWGKLWDYFPWLMVPLPLCFSTPEGSSSHRLSVPPV